MSAIFLCLSTLNPKSHGFMKMGLNFLVAVKKTGSFSEAVKAAKLVEGPMVDKMAAADRHLAEAALESEKQTDEYIRYLNDMNEGQFGRPQVAPKPAPRGPEYRVINHVVGEKKAPTTMKDMLYVRINNRFVPENPSNVYDIDGEKVIYVDKRRYTYEEVMGKPSSAQATQAVGAVTQTANQGGAAQADVRQAAAVEGSLSAQQAMMQALSGQAAGGTTNNSMLEDLMKTQKKIQERDQLLDDLMNDK